MGRLEEHEGDQKQLFPRRCDAFSRSPAAGRKLNVPWPIFGPLSRSTLAPLAGKNSENAESRVLDK